VLVPFYFAVGYLHIPVYTFTFLAPWHCALSKQGILKGSINFSVSCFNLLKVLVRFVTATAIVTAGISENPPTMKAL